MPRQDRTFSDADIIRIWCKNLTTREKLNVVIFFGEIVPSVIDRALENTRFLTLEGLLLLVYRGISKTLLKTLRRALLPKLVIRLRILILLFPDAKIRKEIRACITELPRVDLAATLEPFAGGD